MKKPLSLLLSVILILLCAFSAPYTAMAKQGEIVIVDDLYESESFELSFDKRLAGNSELKRVSDELKQAMIMRRSTCTSELDIPVQSYGGLDSFMKTVFYEAVSCESSISSLDGDYIHWQVSNLSARYIYSDALERYTVIFSIDYYNTARQERETNNAINAYLSSLDLEAYTDYELLREFHNHILEICTYNTTNLYKESNFTAYGVFCVGKAVCQGYALAFYRLCREVGLDCCIVTSDPSEGCHAWNLVWCGDKYYFVDCTWDDGIYDGTEDERFTDCDSYEYFLVDYDALRAKDSDHFEHKLYEELHDNDYFNNTYRNKISASRYDNSKKSISNCVISGNGNALSYNGHSLTKGVDYTVSQSASSFAVINGKGDFASTSTTRDFSIIKADIKFTQGYKYTGNVIEPEVTVKGLTRDKDYQLFCFDSAAGNAAFYLVGIGRYSGIYCGDFKIYKSDLNDFKIKLSFTETYYNGAVQKPSVTINGLVETRDYTVKYDAISEVGTGYVYVTGKGSCTGSAKLSYKIVKRDIASNKIKLSSTSFEYNGYAREPKVTISGLKENQDFKVSYKNNKMPGKASVIVTGMGTYTGSVTLTFTIKPKKTSIKKLTTSKKSITVTFGKVTGADGYELEYSTSSSFKSSKKVKLSASKTSKKISKLKKGKKYYFRVRAYKKCNDKKLYASWSAKKSISCK